MKKGNVLFIGNSGVGKTTLINTILGTDAATGIGVEGTTKTTKVYENDEIPFRIIDTMGFEPTKLFQQNKAVSDVRKWSKKSVDNTEEDTVIDLICLCVDGTSSKLFSKTIDDFLKAISIWKSVPIIVAITKSYSLPDREANIRMVSDAFKDKTRTPCYIIPIVASPYVISEDFVVPPDGIAEFIEAINELLPAGIKAAKADVERYILNRKRFQAQSSVISFTGIGVLVGAVPLPFADALLLAPTETAEINIISRVYEISKDEKYRVFKESMIDVGTVSVVAKGTISAIKAIPGVNVAASVINAVIAGVIVCGIGEAATYVFEQIYLGEKSIDDIEWMKKVVESKLSKDIIERASNLLKTLPENATKQDVLRAVGNLLKK